jgi:hypothetical protein
MGSKLIGWDDVALDVDLWRAVVNAVLNLEVP